MEDHRRADVDPRDAVVKLVPDPPQQVEIVHDAVRPVSEKGRQHPDRNRRPIAPALEIHDRHRRQVRNDQQRRSNIDDEGQCEPGQPDQPPMPEHRHLAI